MTLVPTKSRAGRKTNAERAHRKIEQLNLDAQVEAERVRIERARKWEAKRPDPMSADTRTIQWTVLLGVSLIGIAAFAISYGAVYELAAWTDWAQWQLILTPLLLDAGIVVFTFLSFIRIERKQNAALTFLLAELLTGISAAAQVIHTYFTSSSTGVQLIVACVVSVLPPLVLSACSYFAGRTLFRRAPHAA